MRIPRDCSGHDLVKALRRLGYQQVRQTGSHQILTTQEGGQHHVTIPNHSPIKIGMFSDILKDITVHHKMTVEELVRHLEL